MTFGSLLNILFGLDLRFRPQFMTLHIIQFYLLVICMMADEVMITQSHETQRHATGAK